MQWRGGNDVVKVPIDIEVPALGLLEHAHLVQALTSKVLANNKQGSTRSINTKTER